MEKRESGRDILAQEISFSIQTGPNGQGRPQYLGIIIDSNDAGFCIICSRPLGEGGKILITEGPGRDRKMLAEVKWVRQVSRNVYKAGLVLLGGSAVRD